MAAAKKKQVRRKGATRKGGTRKPQAADLPPAQPININDLNSASGASPERPRRERKQRKRPLWVLRFLRRLRSYLLTGLVVAMPLIITFYLVNWFISFVDNQVLPLSDRFVSSESSETIYAIPGLGLGIAVLLLMILGWFAANIFGQTLIRFGERIVARMPIIRTIYSALKQIFQMVLAQRSANFREVGLIEYPRPGLHAIVFVAKTLSGEIGDKVKARTGATRKGEPRGGGEIIAVFLPTTPNPTSGFLLFLPRRKVIKLDMSVEEGIKMVVSGALLEPEAIKRISSKGSPKRLA